MSRSCNTSSLRRLRSRALGAAGIALFVPMIAAAGQGTDSIEVPGGDELKHLIPDIKTACALVRENPSAWPYRSFPYGPLGLEARKAGAEEAAKIRSFHLGLAAAACNIPLEKVTAAFHCGPDCPRNRRDHLVKQLPDLRAAVASFEKVPALRLLSIWLPRGELRVNDVFVLDGQVREAIPSAKNGLVPSGNWKPWKNLEEYLAGIHVSDQAVSDLTERMYGAGLSALIREKSATRAVGVGVGDNESGLLFLHSGKPAPRVGEIRRNGSKYTIVEEVGPGVWYYETS